MTIASRGAPGFATAILATADIIRVCATETEGAVYGCIDVGLVRFCDGAIKMEDVDTEVGLARFRGSDSQSAAGSLSVKRNN